jgi:hypothetical protein
MPYLTVTKTAVELGVDHRTFDNILARLSDAGHGLALYSRLAPLALLLLGGCANEWTRPSATESEIRSDMTQCLADAEARARVDIEVVESYRAPPPLRSPFGFDRRVPTGVGSGYSRLVYEDINRPAREEIYTRCMTTRGYVQGS